LLQLLLGKERFFHAHSGSADQASHYQCCHQKGDYEHGILRIFSLQIEKGWGKKIIQAPNGHEGKNGRFNEGARQGQQRYEDQVNEACRREIQPEAKARE
jgi:hypothetical protein